VTERPAQDTDPLRLLIDAVVDYAIYMLDGDGRVVSWNPGAQRFKGYTEREILGQHFSRFYTVEDRAVGLPETALRTAREEGRFEHEGWRVRKDGGRFWAHVVIDPIRDRSGAVIGYAKVTRDQSEKKRAQDELQQSEQRFRLLVESVTDYAIYMLDADGNVTSWNAGAQRFKGYEAPEIIGQHFSRFYTDEDRAAGVPALALRTAAEQGRFETENWRVRKDGTRFWAHVVIAPIRDPSGKLIGFAKITRDLSERRLAEEALRRTAEQFRLLVQGVKDYAVYMLDPKGRVTNWNTGAERIKGYSEAEIVGQHFSRFYTEEDAEAGAPAAALATAIREGKFEAETVRRRKDGTRFWAHVLIDPIYDADGTLLGFAKITRDISERRKAEEALAEARASLLQTQKMDAIGQLTGGIAHDFNNLLTAVLGSLELLRKRLPDDPRLMRLLENAMQGAERGATLTQRMLAFARRQELKIEAIDLPELVRGMSDLLRSSVGSAIQIINRVPSQLAHVRGDPNQLELALLNLVVNARDAMPNGGTVVISAREAAGDAARETGLPGGEYVCLSVADTGEGMDADTLARAAEPFFTTKGVGRGTGLGLSMVHGFAEQSGGRLRLQSVPGAGTTAEIWLRTAAPEVRTEQGVAPAEAFAGGGPLTVLVVDDDPLVLMNTAATLEDLGHAVIEASSGQQALRVLRRASKVDVVITDQVMPGMAGTELAAAIKTEWPDLPVILTTGFAELPPDLDPTLPRLPKPFQQDALARALTEALRRPPDPGVVPFRPRRRAEGSGPA
jgi:PAS domain S-box-containing protein